MASAGLLIAAGTLAAIATATTIGLEIVICVDYADKSSLAGASGAAAAVEAVALVVLGALASAQVVQHKMSSCWSRSKTSFIIQLLVCIAAAAASIVALIFFHQSMLDQGHQTPVHVGPNFVTGLAVSLAFAAVFQFIFISSYFFSHSDAAIKSSSPYQTGVDWRIKHVKGIRYSQTMPMVTCQETTYVKKREAAAASHPKTKSRVNLKISVPQAIRSRSSRTRLLGFEWRRPISLEPTPESPPSRTSADTSFDSWDTSSVDAHNRQVVMELASPTAIKRALETIPASPSGSLTSSPPATPRDSVCLGPPQALRRIESYSSSLRSQCEANRLTSDSSINEMHIHPLFRSDSAVPPPAATPGTSVLAAPHAGLIIPRRGSLQSLSRLRGGSLPVARSPTMQQFSLESAKQIRTRDGGQETQRDGSSISERRITPPIPDWVLSPAMKAGLDSFKEQR